MWVCYTILNQWTRSRIDDDHLCGLGVFWSSRWLGISFTASISLEELAIGSGELGSLDDIPGLLEGIRFATASWIALLGGCGRFLRGRNVDESAEKKLCFFCCWSDMLWSGCNVAEIACQTNWYESGSKRWIVST